MPTITVLGGQYGGEGKGLVAAALAKAKKPVIVLKMGGPNCAHTINSGNMQVSLRMLPTAAYVGIPMIAYPPGCMVSVDRLMYEIRNSSFSGRVIIDPKAGIVDAECVSSQKADSFYSEYGSTLTGTGAAAALRARRRLGLAKDQPEIKDFIGEVVPIVRDLISKNKTILIEGSQGFGLSNYHGEYPFTTSRDTTIGAVISQTGIGPAHLDTIVMVLKCFPTRNRPGESHLPNELPDDFISSNAGALEEFGGGSYDEKGQRRRVGLFDFKIVERAIFSNSPNVLALTGLDRLKRLIHIPNIRDHYKSAEEFPKMLEKHTGISVGVESWGPDIDDVEIKF